MAQKLTKIKSLGGRQTYNIGINTEEHLWVYKGLINRNSFNQPHSFAYSLMGYVQAYLKTYYPVEFWVATLNTIDKGQKKHEQSSLGKYVNSIQNAGIKVIKPNVNTSGIIFEADDDNNIPFALSYIKDVSKGADVVIANRPYENWDDFLQKAIEKKFNKRIVKGLIFSGGCDFEDEINDRPYKWLHYLTEKIGNRNNKKLQEEIDEFQNNIPQDFALIEMEYDYCKYSFTGLDDYVDTSGSSVPVSQRQENKKLWSLIGYVSGITQKKSKKSGNRYTLLTLTDFRDTISVFVFGDEMRKELEQKAGTGTLVKAVVKNDGGWLKLPWPKEIGGQFPVKELR